ncbi:MAG: DUF1361 domain-containing protein [Bacteroidota bacterium]
MQRRKQMLVMLIISSMFSAGLLLFRFIYTSNITFIFLGWNLVLAWIPFMISYAYSYYDERFRSRIILFFTIMIWFPFFPNAPYIITDLFHLWEKHDIPLWFDLILILSFAWNGILLGFLSLFEFQRIISRRISVFYGWAFAIAAIFAGSFGVYVGRYLRWNSWDIISHPLCLARDMADVVLHPVKNTSGWGMTLFLSCFFIVSYLSVRYMAGIKVK